MVKYSKIVETIIERMSETNNKDKIYAYLDIAQLIRDEIINQYELEERNKKDTKDNWFNAGNDKDQ